jgi:hypothetical protein
MGPPSGQSGESVGGSSMAMMSQQQQLQSQPARLQQQNTKMPAGGTQQVTPETRQQTTQQQQMVPPEFMSPPSSVRRRSPSQSPTAQLTSSSSSTKRPRRSGTCFRLVRLEGKSIRSCWNQVGWSFCFPPRVRYEFHSFDSNCTVLIGYSCAGACASFFLIVNGTLDIYVIFGDEYVGPVNFWSYKYRPVSSV